MALKSRRIAIRSRIITVLVLGVLVAFGVRLFDIQVFNAASINDESRTNRARVEVVEGPRGEIVDRNGAILADNIEKFDVILSPVDVAQIDRKIDDPKNPDQKIDSVYSVEQATEDLGKILEIPGVQIRDNIAAALKTNPKSQFSYLARNVDADLVSRIKELGIGWVYTQSHLERRYPNGAVAGNLVGFTNIDNEGIAGEELSKESCLAGSDGKTSYIESGQEYVKIPGTELVEKVAKPGGELKLTIDSELQWAVQRIATAQVAATGAQWAVVTVMEAKTGKLLVVADVPTVDPNNPTGVAPDDRGSRAFTAPFEPGSTFKTLTSAVVIDQGKANLTDQIWVPNRLDRPNVSVKDSYEHGTIPLTLTGVMVESSNIGMSIFGERVDDETRVDYFKNFGLGAKTNVGFPAEAEGDLHGDPTEWDPQTKYATMFGQGLTLSAIQLTSLYQTIANHGVRLPVQLVESCGGVPSVLPQPTQVVSSNAAQQVSDMLEQVYRKGYLAKVWNVPGYRVASKTGTAQVADGQGGYLPGYLVAVAGFAPANDPQYVVTVNLMNPVRMNSSAAAAPVFRDVMLQVLQKFRVLPSDLSAPDIATTW